MEAKKRVAGGRPRKHSPNTKRPVMAFRLNAALYEKLTASAALNERSLSGEIERLLEEHFTVTDHRTIIREEIRAALAERNAVPRGAVLGSPWHTRYVDDHAPVVQSAVNTTAAQTGLYGKALNATPQQTYDRSALNRKQ